MLIHILRFEWRYQTRHLTFAAAAAGFALLGFQLAATGYGPADVHVNSPYSVAQSVGLLSLVSVFALTLFCAQSLLRDGEHRMAEIFYTTRITKARYLFGRFAGSLLAAAAAFAAALPGMLLGALLAGHDPARLGPVHAFDYLWAVAVLAVPNMLFAGALLFAVAALTRSALATYVGGVALYVLYFAAAQLTGSPLMATSAPPTPESLAAAALADPFGLSAFFEQTHYWTAAERNVRRLPLAGSLAANRLLWTGISLAVLGLVHRLFAFRVDRRSSPRSPPFSKEVRQEEERPAPVHPFEKGSLGGISPLVSATKLELRLALGSWPFVALLGMWVGVVGIELLQNFRAAEFGTALLPATGLVIGHLREPLSLFGLLAIVYFSAELVWRERTARLDQIADATPVASCVFLVSKAAALAALVGVLTAVAAGVATVFQLAVGYTALEPGLYASLLYFTGLPLVLVAVLALLLQTLAPNRYVGMLATLIAAVILHKGGLGGPEHPLLRYAAAPPVPYSAMNGFGPAALSFTWIMAYWTAFAALLALLTCGLWRRGTDARLTPRLAALRRPWSRAARRAAASLGAIVAVVGGLVFYQVNGVNAYETAAQTLDWKAAYERAYGRLETVPQPSLAHVEAEVDLYPAERRYRVRGRYRLENRTGEAVGTVWVVVRRDVALEALSLAGASPTSHDARFGMHAFALARPLAPGAAAELTFEVEVARRGATADPDYDVVANGSFLLSPFAFPALGYRRGYELTDPDERRRRGLPERRRPATIEGAVAAGLTDDPARVTFATTVSTPADQIAIAPGALRETWEEGGRRFFHYAPEGPVRPVFAYASARYAVERVRHGGVEVEVYYHPEHGANVGRFLAAATRALDYCVTRFGPYPHPQLRLVEVPAHWDRFSGFAMPGVVFVVEDHGFLTDLRDGGRVDVVTKRVAHEVAHQWWGHQLVPADEPGASALVESLARYTELMVLKDAYGEAALAPVLAVELDRYLTGRTGGDEVPLYQVGDQGYLYYSKGALVMMALHDLVGEEAVNRALGGLFAKAAGAPTSLDLLDELYRVTPADRRALVDQWWKEIVLYDLRVASAAYAPLADGRYRVTARLAAAKSAVDGGAERPLAMDEEIAVAVYAEHPDAGGGVLYAGRHRVGGEAEIAVTVDAPPRYVVIDPWLRRIDRNRVDNVRKVLPPG